MVTPFTYIPSIAGLLAYARYWIVPLGQFEVRSQ
jgi:hypothetical protein